MKAKKFLVVFFAALLPLEGLLGGQALVLLARP